MPQYELNLRDYWRLIRNRQMILWVIFFAVFISVVINTNMQNPVYQAVASVRWIERRTLASLLTNLADFPIQTGEPLVTQSRIITSFPVIEQVVKELKLVSENASAEEFMQQAAAIQGAVSTSIAEGTNIIYINVTYENPQMAANIANKVAEVYIAENLKEKSKQSRNVREFIEKQLQEVSVKLKNSEERLARFKEIEVPQGIAIPLQGRLADLEAKRQDLLRVYTNIHPDVKDIERDILQVKEQLRVLPKRELEYSRLQREVDMNVTLYQDFKQKLAGARIAEAEKVEDVSLVNRAVPSTAPIRPNKSANYFTGAVIGLILGISGAFIVEQLDASIGTIEDMENYLKLPALGVIPYLKTEGEKKRGLIKLWPKKLRGKEKVLHLRKQLLIHYYSSSPIFEAYRILRANIQNEVFKKEQIKGKTLLFSSASPEEGKSITVSNLAISMAQGNFRTLLMDGDMRRSAIHKIFGIKNRDPGLANVLREGIKPEEAIKTFTDILMGELGFDEALKLPGLDNLNILTSGSSPALSAELLSSPQMLQLLENLKAKFDIILIDSPPVLAVADAAILASKVDGVILVYNVGKTNRSVLSRTKTQIVESGGLLKGAILNNISAQMEMRYGYYYHYKYYGKYYTDKKPKK